MSATDPVSWDPLVELGVHTSLQCEALFERRRDDLDPDWDRETAVARLYEWWHETAGDDPGNEQGGVYVFAYLLERERLVDPRKGPDAGDFAIPPAILARRPDDATLERWFWDEEQVPWWIAVRCGVHYSLVQYWLYEADIPVMRRNVPDQVLEQVDAMTDGP
jgi:hypothetical protein